MTSRLVAILLCLATILAPAAADSLDDLQSLLEQKNYAAAETGAALLRTNPDGEGVRFLTAYAMQMNAQTEQAIALYRALIADNPRLPASNGRAARSTPRCEIRPASTTRSRD